MKRTLCFILALFALWTASGQFFLEDVHLSLNKGFEGVYAKGDSLKVYAEVEKDTPALLKVYQNGRAATRTNLPELRGNSRSFNIFVPDKHRSASLRESS